MMHILVAAIPYVEHERELYETLKGVTFPTVFLCLLLCGAILVYAFKHRK
jgi:hypothetical protein